MPSTKDEIVDNNLGFMSRVLAQVSLPHSEPVKNTHIYQRKTGQITLSVIGSEFGLPYGTYPRLLLAWICTEAIKKQNPVLHLGTNQTDFLKKLNISRAGSTIAILKEQTNRLLNSSFRITYETEKSKANQRFFLAENDIEFWDPHSGDWETYLTLSNSFFEDIMSSPVPLDLNVLNAIRKSPLAMDVYTWLAYRTFGIYVTGNQPVKIKWADLQAQFGSNYGSDYLNIVNIELPADVLIKKQQQGLYDFRSSFLTQLQKLQAFYPELTQIITADSQFLTIGGAKLIK